MLKRHLKQVNKHDVAKVLVGFSASELISHFVLGMSGLFTQLQTLGLPVSSSSNMIILIFWAIVFVVSVHFAWFKK